MGKIVGKLDAAGAALAGRGPEKNLHDIRVGFSLGTSDLQLGEDAHSYAIAMDGKKCTQKFFSDFLATPLAVGDVVTACVDLDSSPKRLFYLVNGEARGNAFELPEVDQPEEEEEEEVKELENKKGFKTKK